MSIQVSGKEGAGVKYEIETDDKGNVISAAQAHMVDEDRMMKRKRLQAGEMGELGLKLMNHAWGINNQDVVDEKGE